MALLIKLKTKKAYVTASCNLARVFPCLLRRPVDRAGLAQTRERAVRLRRVGPPVSAGFS
jgi:hypothetical protein